MDEALKGGAELALTIYRWQFGIVTVYHYLMVPLTLGLSFMVAMMQTLAVRHRSRHWYASTRFFGKLLILNFAVGVATGIVQEFQFGMNWPEFSRYVGDIFGAPLGMEGMLAFFCESTFLGLWIFGWGQLRPKIHLMTIWCVALGANLSAVFIVGANSWMQHPVGAVFNPATGRAEVNGFWGLFQIGTNWTIWMAVAHVIFTAWMVAGSLVVGTSLYHLRRSALGQSKTGHLLRPAAVMGAFFLLLGSITTLISGHIQALQIATEQPMKFAAGEALCKPIKEGEGAPFVIAAFGNSCETLKTVGEVPHALSIMASGSPGTKLNSVPEVNKAYRAYFSQPEHVSGLTDNYMPPLMITFWSFRFMVFFGFLTFLVGLWAAIVLRKKDSVPPKALVRVAGWGVPLPFFASMFGWMYTEIGRQPWLVHPNFDTQKADVYMLTSAGISGLSSVTSAALTTTVFVLLYLVLCIAWAKLLIQNARAGLDKMVRVPKRRVPVDTTMKFGEEPQPVRRRTAMEIVDERLAAEWGEVPSDTPESDRPEGGR